MALEIGKSRTLTEFRNLCIASVSDGKLKERLKKAFVFMVSFSKQTHSVGDFRERDKESCHCQWCKGRWDSYALSTYWTLQSTCESFAKLQQNQRTSPEVLDALAQGESLNPRDMTVVIVVDGIHDLPHNPEQMDSMMKTAIDSITEIVNVATQQFDTRGIRLFFFFF